MEHVDPEDLALIALGEPADAGTRAHLEACDPCSDDVAALATTVATARSVTPADAPAPPPPAVWEAIRTELALPADLRPDTEPATADDDAPLADVVPLRRRRALWITSAAAAGVIIGAAGGALMASDVGAPVAPVVAEAPLEPLPGWSSTGQAAVRTLPDGGRELVVSMEEALDQEGYREVWLIDREVTRLVSLGVLEGSEGVFTVPEGLDLTDFAVVDVSDEPFDGDPAHSGDSIVRGILDT